MPTPTEFGTTREVWFATLDAPSTKHSFLIRDDAYSRGGASFGRTLRLGDPINLGPNSTWRQLSWEGGSLQNLWNDEAMFLDGFADGSLGERGKLMLWPGWWQITGKTAPGFSRYTLARGTSGWGQDIPLYGGECDTTPGPPTTATAFTFFKFNIATDTVTALKGDFVAPIRAISNMNTDADAQFWVAIGLGNGEFWIYNPTTNVFTKELNASAGVGYDCIVPFGNAVYYSLGNAIWRRTYTPGTGLAHTKVFQANNAAWITSMVVWNNRLWFTAAREGANTDVYVSDGTTTTAAFSMDEFVAQNIKVHYGSLYLAGFRPQASFAGGVQAEVHRYTGASLTLLWNRITNGANYPWTLLSWGRYLVWGRTGNAASRRCGVYLYDAEADAIFDGPNFISDPAVSGEMIVTCLGEWNTTLVLSAWDNTTGGGVTNPVGVWFLRLGRKVRSKMGTYGTSRSFAAQPTTISQPITSSRYDADLPGEQKAWMAARVRCKLEANTQIRFCVLLDEGTTEKALTTITHGGNSNWRNVVIPLKDTNGKYLKSTRIQYRVYVEHTSNADLESVATPIVDSVEVDFMVSPTKRRQYKLRVLASDAQKRLDGTNNPLSTTQAIQDKLEELWAAQEPLLFWDAGTVGGVPAGAGTEVFIQEWQDQSYRLETSDTAKNADIALGLVEVVNV